ncbi:MAG: amidohydrolase family protein [Candidatus Scalinduaceae bacterium]
MKDNDFFIDKGNHLVTTPVCSMGIENGEVIMEQQQIKVKNGQIISTEPYQGHADLFVTAGFVNCHMHWLMLGEASLQRAYELILNSPEEMIELVVENARATVKAGIIACCDKGPPGIKTANIYYGLLDAKNRGVPVPKTVYSTWTVGVEDSFASKFLRVVQNNEDLQKLLDELQETGAGLLKAIPESPFLPDDFTYKFVFPEPLFDLARKITISKSILFAIHAKGHDTIEMGLKYKVDCIEHCIEATAKHLKEMQKQGIFLGPTLEGFWCRLEHAQKSGSGLAAAGYEWAAVTSMFRNAASLNDDGSPFANMLFASDAGSFTTPHASLKELYFMRKFGLSPPHVFEAATLNGAKLLRMQDKIGCLRVGYDADLIFWSRNPLELSLDDWSHLKDFISAVMVGGKIVHIN